MERPTESTLPPRTATAVPDGQPGSMVTTCFAVNTVIGGPVSAAVVDESAAARIAVQKAIEGAGRRGPCMGEGYVLSRARSAKSAASGRIRAVRTAFHAIRGQSANM